VVRQRNTARLSKAINYSKSPVTGYLVPRIGDGPQPVVTLDQQFFKEQGDQTVADVLQRLPQNPKASIRLSTRGKAFRRAHLPSIDSACRKK
jgi:hypothetical protein